MAKQILNAHLCAGEQVLSSIIVDDAKERGVSYPTLSRVANELGVIRKVLEWHGPAYWWLEEEIASRTKAQAETLPGEIEEPEDKAEFLRRFRAKENEIEEKSRLFLRN